MIKLAHTILALGLGAVLLHAADDTRPVICADVDPGPYVFSLDLANLLEAASTAKPTSLWWDPDCEKHRAYATSQIRLAASMQSEMPPLLEALAFAKSGILVGYEQSPDMNIRDPLMVFLADMGQSKKAWSDWILYQISNGNKRDVEEQAGVINGYSGFYEKADMDRRQQSAFFGFKENIMLVGMVPAIKDPAAGIDPSTLPPAPVTLQIDGSKLFERMKFISEHAQWDPFDFKDWGFLTTGMAPKTRITVTPMAEGWEGEIELEGLGDYTCKPLSDAILKTIPSGSVMWWAEHIDIKHIVKNISPKMSKLENEKAQIAFGTDLNSAADWFTGNISFALKPAAIIPEMTLTAEITNEEAAITQLNQHFAQFAQATPAAGSKASWQILGAMPMILSIGVGDGKIVLSNNPLNISNVLKGENLLDTSAAAGTVAYVYADLPTIGQMYLPLVWGMLKSAKEKLAQTALDSARWDIRNAFQKLADVDTIDNPTMEKALQSLWRRERVEALFQPETDLAQNCLDHFSVWNANDKKKNQMNIFVRTQHGYQDLGSWGRNNLTAEDVEGLIGNKNKLCGPDTDKLPVITIQDPPMFDGNWIPDLPTVLRHLPIYELATTSDATGKLLIKEKGIPLASIFGGILASEVWFETADRYARVTRDANRKAQQAIDKDKVEAEVKAQPANEKMDDF